MSLLLGFVFLAFFYNLIAANPDLLRSKNPTILVGLLIGYLLGG